MKVKRMELNRETAMRLWSKTFGKSTKTTDFSGRVIAKSAYNDRNSEFGWNVDHILPQSKGGKTADYNLIVCHILTNDEKADKFPGFVANKKRFTIIKVENHYEIKPEKETPIKEASQKNDDETNLYDSASGIRLYKKFKGYQTKKRFVGTVEIFLSGISGADTALTDFIEEMFIDEDVQFVDGSSYYLGTSVKMLVKNYEMPYVEDADNLLDKCILLNTYLLYYFKPLGIVDDFDISYRVDCYHDRKEFYSEDKHVGFRKPSWLRNENCHLRINGLVVKNTSAKDKIEDFDNDDPNCYYDYEYIYTNLANNLKKEVSGK
ncbi:MAG: hypothetical protein K6E87_00930 [bacterium]|nr:hypothetical protein [bacterium]